MKNFLLALLLSANSLAHAASLEQSFQNPPHEYRPETWFHFIGGNIGKAGISADLEAIQKAGIGGIQLFHGNNGGPWPGVSPQITCLSPQWDDAIRHTSLECQKLGLDFTMQNCPGWSLAGGPWIEPQDAMRHLTWSRVQAKGGGNLSLNLPQAGGGDYRDVAVLAFPTPDGDEQTLVPQRVRSNRPDLLWLDLFDPAKKAEANWSSDNEAAWVEVEFDAPVTLRSLQLPNVKATTSGKYFDPALTIRVQAISNGQTTELGRRALPRTTWQDNRPLTLAFSEGTARTFRITFEKSNSVPVNLSFLRLSSSARLNDWEGEAGYTLRSLDNSAAPIQSKNSFVDNSKIVDLSAQFKEGKLTWNAPAGDWTILRFGHVLTGARNGPAPPEATGWECDKFSRAAAQKHFQNYVGRLSAPDGPAGARLQGLLLDSWECGTQTWTGAMESEFQNRRGYALRSWLPALAGYVISDHETSARFLRDWRATVSDLITENFFDETARLAKERNLKTSFETALGDVSPGDILQYLGKADVPMCEFWQPDDPDRGGEETKPILPAASAAHIYGKKRLASESFTSVDLHWNEHPGMLKAFADHNFAQGITHLVFHTYTHNPRTDLVPGTTFGGGIGTPFLRGQTWWKNMPAFTDYLARCSYLLEQGAPVSDVLWYLGDEVDHKLRQDAPFPKGYRFDYCNPDALLHRLKVQKDQLTNLEGTKWRLLWLRDGMRLTPETLFRLRDLLRDGATILAAPPRANSTLSGENSDARFARLKSELWGKLPTPQGDKRLGAGRLLWGIGIEQALQKMNIAPDVSGGENFDWIHRQTADSDIYFVAAPAFSPLRGSLGFRATGDVQIFDAISGTTRPAIVSKRDGGRTFVGLDLPPSGSAFVVFRKGQSAATVTRITREGKTIFDAETPPKIERGIQIVKAIYGIENDPQRQVDVTARIQEMVNKGATSISGNNGLAGDPALKTVKSFVVTWRTAKGEETVQAREGQGIALPAPFIENSAIETLNDGQLLALQNGKYTMTDAKGKARKIEIKNAQTQTLDGPWTLHFPPGWDAPEKVDLPKLQLWSELQNPAARYFSGSATYECDFAVDNLVSGSHLLLDLGDIKNSAEVKINGQRAALLWTAPFRCDITRFVKVGANKLEITVTNTWRNRLSYDAGLPEAERKTWTLAAPPPNINPEPAGLIGPVRLIRAVALR